MTRMDAVATRCADAERAPLGRAVLYDAFLNRLGYWFTRARVTEAQAVALAQQVARRNGRRYATLADARAAARMLVDQIFARLGGKGV